MYDVCNIIFGSYKTLGQKHCEVKKMLKYVEKKNVERTNVASKFVDGPKYLASNFCQSKFNNFNVFAEN